MATDEATTRTIGSCVLAAVRAQDLAITVAMLESQLASCTCELHDALADVERWRSRFEWLQNHTLGTQDRRESNRRDPTAAYLSRLGERRLVRDRRRWM